MTSDADTNAPQPRVYTPDDVVQQSLIAFGQGTNYMRVNREAAQYVVDVMRSSIERFKIHENWETEAVQYLERLRAMGRASALYATQDGQTVITPEVVARATSKVQRVSRSTGCLEDGTPINTALFPTD